MAVTISLGYVDRSREYSRTEWLVENGPLNDITTEIVAANAVQAAIGVVTLCNFTNLNLTHLVEADVPTIPTSPYAQRESALWIQYVDTVDGSYQTMSIPGPDKTLLAQANTDEVDIVANVTAAALVLVLEANLVSDQDNPIEVTRMRLIGRSN